MAASLFYILGGIFFNAMKISLEGAYLKLFAHLLCGIFVTVFLYSFIITRGITVNIGLIIPFGILVSMVYKVHDKRERLPDTLAMNYKIILLSVILILLVCGYSFSFLLDGNTHQLLPPERDKVFYARVADYLNNQGIESNFLNYYGMNQPSPFHYFEIWIAAFIEKVSGLNTLLIQELIVNSILFLILYSGALALINLYKRITIYDLFICLSIPFFMGIKFFFLPQALLHHIDSFFFLNPILRHKYFVVSILFLASSILFLKNRNDLALLILLIGCYFNFSLIASVPITVIILCFLIKVDNKIKILVAAIMTPAFILLFYHFNNTTKMMIDNPSLLFLIQDSFSSMANLKIVINNTAKSITEVILIFLPFALLLFFLLRAERLYSKGLKAILITVFILFILSAFEWSLFNKKLDSIQVFDNISIPLVGITAFIIIALIIAQTKTIFRLTSYIIIAAWGIACFNKTNAQLNVTKEKEINYYSPEYLSAVKSKLLSLNNKGGSLMNVEGHYTFVSTLFMAYSYKNYLALMKNNINITLLQSTMDIDLPDESIYRKQILELQKREVFNNYIIHQKEKNEFFSEEQSRVDFIKENHLEYIIADNDVEIDSSIQKMTEEAIVDKLSGERFIVLKR